MLLAVALATLTSKGQARESKDANELKVAQAVEGSLMRQKLEHAQQLLSALSLGDYDRMVMHAHELQRISIEARWSQPHSPSYAQYGDDFRSALDRMVAAAQKQNIDGAALNYVQVVLTCVQCHKVVREGERTAGATDLGDFGLLQRVAQIPSR
jgi:gentisate 1,2-dioxygenase